MRKTGMKVLDDGSLAAYCKCNSSSSWQSIAFVQTSGLVEAMEACAKELALHKCPPKVKKARAKRKKEKNA